MDAVDMEKLEKLKSASAGRTEMNSKFSSFQAQPRKKKLRETAGPGKPLLRGRGGERRAVLVLTARKSRSNVLLESLLLKNAHDAMSRITVDAR